MLEQKTELKPRIDWKSVAPDVYHAMHGLEECVSKAGIERSLLHLVKTRASQINGCAHCLDMHTKDARFDGESEERLYLLSVWRESPFFTPRERAALAWTEAVTRLGEHGVPDEVYELARRQFTEKELVCLTLAVIAINGWNRMNVSMRTVPGSYQTAKR